MEEKKSNTFLIVAVCLTVLLVGLYVYITGVGESPAGDNPSSISVPTNEPIKEDQPIDFEDSIFGEEISVEEAQGLVFEKYSNNNLRIVGAVIQEVNNDHLIIKTYRAGEGTTSIVEEKRINITNNTLVFETVMSFEYSPEAGDERITTKKTVSSLQKGDHVVIECAEDKNMKDTEVLTAIMITKDVIMVEEPDEMLPTQETE